MLPGLPVTFPALSCTILPPEVNPLDKRGQSYSLTFTQGCRRQNHSNTTKKKKKGRKNSMKEENSAVSPRPSCGTVTTHRCRGGLSETASGPQPEGHSRRCRKTLCPSVHRPEGPSGTGALSWTPVREGLHPKDRAHIFCTLKSATPAG